MNADARLTECMPLPTAALTLVTTAVLWPVGSRPAPIAVVTCEVAGLGADGAGAAGAATSPVTGPQRGEQHEYGDRELHQGAEGSRRPPPAGVGAAGSRDRPRRMRGAPDVHGGGLDGREALPAPRGVDAQPAAAGRASLLLGHLHPFSTQRPLPPR